MRPEDHGGPLDLNNLPEEDGKQLALEESSTTTAASTETSRFKKKKAGAGAKDESAKVYECRFCSLKFCKSQALGGHMNRHRQERETETLNRARQLVFGNEGLAATAAAGVHHFGLRDVNVGGAAGSFLQQGGPVAGEHCLQFRPGLMFPAGGGAGAAAPPLQQFIYPTTTTSPSLMNYPSSYPPPATSEYFIGHVLPGGSPATTTAAGFGAVDSSYTCFGAPIPPGYLAGAQAPANGAGGRVVEPAATSSQAEGWKNCGSYNKQLN